MRRTELAALVVAMVVSTAVRAEMERRVALEVAA